MSRARFDVVAPFRSFTPEIGHHLQFDQRWWMSAIGMLARSVMAASPRAAVYVITSPDQTNNFPVTVRRVPTHEQRLMLWYLEICAAYLESDYFDRDTIMLDSDQLVFQDLERFFSRSSYDLGVLIRTPRNLNGFDIINGVQFWRHSAKRKLAKFYRQALTRAHALDDRFHVWGADTVALSDLLSPLSVGTHRRCNLTVRMFESERVSRALSFDQIEALHRGRFDLPKVPVLDFRNYRKAHMARVFEAAYGRSR